ncbi:hypothetical protein [Aestuariivirga sp.]|uniref:hypothetical protein n=1 Tax=Aestuariivirga sp. TaxID=2650926 RepID=UPI0039E3F316
MRKDHREAGEADCVSEVRGFPQLCTGAPQPRIVSNEHKLFLIYYTAEPIAPPALLRRRSKNSRVIAVVAFDHFLSFKFGSPNDEALAGHPLYSKGLSFYGIFHVKNSTWIDEVKRINSVHPSFDARYYEQFQHFIFAFHDSTFECIAEDMSFETKSGSLRTAMNECVKLLI